MSKLYVLIVLPETSFHAWIRTERGLMGVRDETSSSLSMFRRDRLSTIVTSWPVAERCSAVGHPQKPSPPRTRTLISPFFAARNHTVRHPSITVPHCRSSQRDGPCRRSDSGGFVRFRLVRFLAWEMAT